MQQKRKGGGDGGKQNKKRYIKRAAPGVSNRGGIPPNTRGILVSCTNTKEHAAAREAIAILTESYEALGGTWKQLPDDAPGGDGDGDGGAAPTDIAAALASEVAELKEGKKQPFFYHLVGIHSVVFVECKDSEGPSPSQLVVHACQRAVDTQQAAARFVNRFYPIEYTCYASMEKMSELAEKVVQEHFPEGAEKGIQFAVQYDARAAPQLDRMEVINAFANLVPAPHKVNLTAPEKTILVGIVKTTCGVAVADQYRQLCRYNIQTCALPEEERERQRQVQQRASGCLPKNQQQAAAAAGEQAATEAAEDQQQQQQQQQQGAEGAEQQQAAAAEGEGKEQQAAEQT